MVHEMTTGLAALEARLALGIERLQEPAPSSVPETRAPDGSLALDVAVLGAGMAGLAAGFALLREGVARVALFDPAAAGLEGPWVTYARMRTLRSPKRLAGPALGLGDLTFRAWFEAQHGAEAFEALGKIPTAMWMAYLRWYRRVAGLDVRNGVGVARIEPEGALFRLALSDGGVAFARHVVLATGRDGLGGPRLLPGFAAAWRGRSWAHGADAVDFAALALNPWLDEGFAFTERVPGAAPHLARLHCFNFAAMLSHGKVTGDVPAISVGAQRLARAVCARLLAADIAEHAARHAGFDEPEISGEEWPGVAL